MWVGLWFLVSELGKLKVIEIVVVKFVYLLGPQTINYLICSY